jgi:hypothetical protein
LENNFFKMNYGPILLPFGGSVGNFQVSLQQLDLQKIKNSSTIQVKRNNNRKSDL